MLALHFSMGGGFLGTPVITLVAPERTTVINSFPLRINGSKERQSLDEAIKRQPMFLENFSVENKLEEIKNLDQYDKCFKDCKPAAGFAYYRLNGTGLRPQAEISIADGPLNAQISSLNDFAQACHDGTPATFQESTRSYLLCFSKPANKHWKVRYSASTRQDLDQARFEHVQVAAEVFASEVRRYRFIPKDSGGPAGELYLTFSIPVEIEGRPTVCFDRKEGVCDPVQKDQDDKFRVHCTLDVSRGERDFVSFRTIAFLKDTHSGMDAPSCTPASAAEQKPVRLASLSPAPPGSDAKSIEETKTWYVDLRLPVRPRLTDITRFPAMNATGATLAFLKGVNLQRVTGVLFGQQPAKVVTSGDPDSMVVEIPPHEVAAGQKEQVPVIFQTDDGAVPSGRTFEYTGPPAVKKSEEGSPKKS